MRAGEAHECATHLVVERGVNLRRCFVHDDHVTPAQDRPGERDELPLPRAQRARLADWRVECGGARRRPAQHGREMAPLEYTPALCITVLAKRV